MIPKETLQEQLKHTFKGTDFQSLGKLYAGKVRDNYMKGDRRILITTDKISAFDRILTTIPFKGQVLNDMTRFWFDNTKHIVPNHFVSVPDPNVVVAKECKPLPVEMVVRGYITGVTSTSAWTHYKNGSRVFAGNNLPEGLKKDQKFDEPIVTPSTKAAHGDHDETVSPAEIYRRGILDKETYEKLAMISLNLYKYGVEVAAKQGIILVDTKYEFGLDADNNIVLIDEIHTPDSSRFWFANEYEERFEKGKEQKKIDKEYVRLWLAEQGFTGDGKIPEILDEVRVEAARRYIQAYELITGQTFKAEAGPVLPRIEKNLKASGLL
ncbi:phosphoribosylaminoimidazolesuccinocarboxamide synthase [Nanoarchaeota archaeon]